MQKGLQRRKSPFGLVHEELTYQIDGIGMRSCLEDLLPGVGRHEGKLKFRIVWIHPVDLIAGRSPQNFDDLHELVGS